MGPCRASDDRRDDLGGKRGPQPPTDHIVYMKVKVISWKNDLSYTQGVPKQRYFLNCWTWHWSWMNLGGKTPTTNRSHRIHKVELEPKLLYIYYISTCHVIIIMYVIHILYILYIICILYNSQNGTESRPHPWWQEGIQPPADHIMKEVFICTMYIQFNLTQKSISYTKKATCDPNHQQIKSYYTWKFPKKKVHFELLNLALIMAESWWQRGTLTTNRSPITSYTWHEAEGT